MVEIDLSIIILNWNTKDLLIQCLESVFEHTNKISFEVIVVDNDSSDGSQSEVKKRFGKKLLFIQNKNNLGFSAGNNPGLKRAKGRYLLLLNSDTKIDYDVFSKMVKWMDSNKEVGILGPKRFNTDGSVQRNGVGNLPSLSSILFNLVLPFHVIPFLNRFTPALHKGYLEFYLKNQQVGWVTGSCFMIRGEVYEQIGGLDENIFMYVEETEYCKRATDEGWEVWYLADEYIWHLERGSSVSGKEGAILGVYKGLIYYFEKHHKLGKVLLAKFLLKLGALFRLPLSMKVYWKAFGSV